SSRERTKITARVARWIMPSCGCRSNFVLVKERIDKDERLLVLVCYRTLNFFRVIFRQPATQDEFSCRFHFVHAAELSGARRVVEQVGLSLGFVRDLDQRVGESVQRVLILRLSWLDHQRFMYDEREVIRRRVEVVIHQTL